jgi:peroxiredoxin
VISSVLTVSVALTLFGAPVEGRKTAPDFELKDLAGKRVKLSTLTASGKVVLIDFWATWCVPCIAALPHLDKLHREFSDKGLVVLSISTDGPQTQAQVRSLVKREKLTMPVLLDPEGKVFGALNPRGTNPFTLIVDRDGKIAESHEGYNSGDERKYREWVERLLAENTKP